MALLAGGESNSAAATAAWWKNFHDSEREVLVTLPGGGWETIEPPAALALN
jgi:hypothetical protein